MRVKTVRSLYLCRCESKHFLVNVLEPFDACQQANENRTLFKGAEVIKHACVKSEAANACVCAPMISTSFHLLRLLKSNFLIFSLMNQTWQYLLKSGRPAIGVCHYGNCALQEVGKTLIYPQAFHHTDKSHRPTSNQL